MPIGALVKMANQIAVNQHYQARSDRVDAVARHIQSFWAPAMIRDLRSHIDAGGTDVDSVARDAIESIS